MEVKRNLFMKMISAFLAAIMIVQILPLNVWGADVQNKTIPEIIQPEDKKINIIQELENESTKYKKVYLADDGSLVSVSSIEQNDDISLLSDDGSLEKDMIPYPEENFNNGKSKIGNEGEAGFIVKPAISLLGNIFVENAYVTIHCDDITEYFNVYAALIGSDYGDNYKNISISDTLD